MSVVNVGDRVRVTCGESVIVGTAKWISPKTCLAVSVDGGGDEYRCYLQADAWTVEVLTAPIPDVVGTIVRDRDGRPWLRGGRGWLSVGYANAETLEAIQRELGPFTVLWPPEATS